MPQDEGQRSCPASHRKDGEAPNTPVGRVPRAPITPRVNTDDRAPFRLVTVTAPSQPPQSRTACPRPDSTLQITDDPLQLALCARGSHGNQLCPWGRLGTSCLGPVSRSQSPWRHLQGEEKAREEAVTNTVQTAEGRCSGHQVARLGGCSSWEGPDLSA